LGHGGSRGMPWLTHTGVADLPEKKRRSLTDAAMRVQISCREKDLEFTESTSPDRFD